MGFEYFFSLRREILSASANLLLMAPSLIINYVEDNFVGKGILSKKDKALHEYSRINNATFGFYSLGKIFNSEDLKSYREY